MRFCEYMQKMMEQYNYTIGDVEYITGLSYTTIYDHIRGKYFPSKRSFLKYLAAFRCRCHDFREVYKRFKEEEIKYKKSV